MIIFISTKVNTYIQKTFVDNGNLFRGLGKDSIADQSAISLIICATGICWNQVVCKRMAGKQRLCLVMENLSETQRSK